mmetsp:Transcript_8204/g.37338  ORF Transcript_8204/g.37338 Transcript_8204/m.37338 type:complete len:252 (-) Transcript_8204:140-895(-)
MVRGGVVGIESVGIESVGVAVLLVHALSLGLLLLLSLGLLLRGAGVRLGGGAVQRGVALGQGNHTLAGNRASGLGLPLLVPLRLGRDERAATLGRRDRLLPVGFKLVMHLNLDDVTHVRLVLTTTLTPARLGLSRRRFGIAVGGVRGGAGAGAVSLAFPFAAAGLLRLFPGGSAVAVAQRGGDGVRGRDAALEAGLAADGNVGESQPRNLLDDHLRSRLLAGRRRVAVRAVTSSFAKLRRLARLALCHILT